ncbi:MAG: response regulator transcription factor [Candidatus Goldbacteria bacterium]|nr:response regulator transcription factor [Candidatus Goldiibacteriota bacterium]
MDKLIFVVDDEKDIRELVSVNLKKYGFKSKEFSDGSSMLVALPRIKPDLIILDVMMPGMDGIEITKKLKSDKNYNDIPIIILTAKTDETDKIVGLEMGADDYVSKPFSPKELIARIKAVLRRFSKNVDERQKIVKYKNITIDEQRVEVLMNNKPLKLTATEYNILRILIENKDRVCSRDYLMSNLWGDEKIVIDRTIDVHIKHLRDKLGPNGKMIKNIRGFGYKISNEK